MAKDTKDQVLHVEESHQKGDRDPPESNVPTKVGSRIMVFTRSVRELCPPIRTGQDYVIMFSRAHIT